MCATCTYYISLKQYYCVLPEIYMMQPATLMRMIVLIDVPDTPYISGIVRLPHTGQYEKPHLNIISYIETIRKHHMTHIYVHHISIRVTCFNISMLYLFLILCSNAFHPLYVVSKITPYRYYSVPDEKWNIYDPFI